MTITTLIILLLVGIVFLVLELLFFPGISFAGIIAAVVFIGSIMIGYNLYGKQGALITTLIVLVVVGVTIYFALKPSTWNRASLHSEIDSKANVIENINRGDTGITISSLKPVGNIQVGNSVFEAHCIGAIIEPGTEIIIEEITGSKIIVKPKT